MNQSCDVVADCWAQFLSHKRTCPLIVSQQLCTFLVLPVTFLSRLRSVDVVQTLSLVTSSAFLQLGARGTHHNRSLGIRHRDFRDASIPFPGENPLHVMLLDFGDSNLLRRAYAQVSPL